VTEDWRTTGVARASGYGCQSAKAEKRDSLKELDGTEGWGARLPGGGSEATWRLAEVDITTAALVMPRGFALVPAGPPEWPSRARRHKCREPKRCACIHRRP